MTIARVGIDKPVIRRGTNGTAKLTPIGVQGADGAPGTPGPGAAAWAASTAVTSGAVRQAPDGSWIKSTASRTTRSSFDATEQTFWTAVLGTSGTIEADALAASFVGVFTPEAHGAVGDGTTTNDAAAIQAAADAALAAGGLFYAEGTYRINSTIQLECDYDLSRSTFNWYGGAGLAVRVGSATAGAVTDSKVMWTPNVVDAAKTGTGWSGGHLGVQVNNLNACEVHFAKIVGFDDGLTVYGNNQGTVHNKFFLGPLEHNKRQIVLEATVTGWVNSNTFYDGRCLHSPAEGTGVSGVRCLVIGLSNNSDHNNNVFINLAVEGDVAEWMLDTGRATNNMYISFRWEGTTPKVRWGAQSSGNKIVEGYRAYLLAVTQTAGGFANTMDVIGRSEFIGIDARPPVQIAPAGVSDLAFGIYTHGEIGDSTDIRWYADERYLYGQSPAQTYPTIKIDNVSGRVYLGDGTIDPATSYGVIPGGFLVWGGVAVAGTSAISGDPLGWKREMVNGTWVKTPYWAD